MSIRESVSIKRRYSGRSKRLDPFKNYYISMEGTRTEPLYFQYLIQFRRLLRIQSRIEIIPLERTEQDEGRTQPEELLKIIIDFRKERIRDGLDQQGDDEYCMMFDRDSYKNSLYPKEQYLAFIKKAERFGIRLIITSPCFELWLLLHKKNSVENIIHPNYQALLENPKVSSNHTMASKLFIDTFGYSPKSRIDQDLILALPTAYEETKKLSHTIAEFHEQLGENVSTFIKDLQVDVRFDRE